MNQTISQQTLDALSTADPAWLRSQRATAFQTFSALPLPSRRDVDWQRFDIRALNLDKISLPLNGTRSITETLTPLPADLAKKGVIFCDIATALQKHSDLVREYLGKSIAPNEPSKFAALHSAFWNTGAFLYVPRGVQIPVPLEVTYQFSGANVAGFPHTLVVVEAGAEATLVQRFIGGAISDGSASVPLANSEKFSQSASGTLALPTSSRSPIKDFTIRERNLPHFQSPGTTYFVTFRTADKRKLSSTERDNVLGACRFWDGKKIHLHSVVVMPDHVHLLLRPLPLKVDPTHLHAEGFYDLGEVLHSIKSFSAHEINKKAKSEGAVWLHDNFDRMVRDDAEFHEKWNYMAKNPFKAGLVSENIDYKWFWHSGVLDGGASVPLANSNQSSKSASETLALPNQKTGGTPVPPSEKFPPSLHASGTEVFVKEGGRLHYISLQNFDKSVFDFTVKRAHVARDAEIDWVIGMFGASFQRYDIECVMEGEGGTSFMYGVGVGDDRQQFGQFTKQHHTVGNTVSDLMFKNVLRDQSVSNYAGVIKVEKNANGTNAYQSNKNLVLSDAVKCDTRPILEIESNQLRCTHGATVGRLDENQIYYLRTRGISETQARELLIEAFLEPIMARIKVESVYKEFAELVHRKVTR